MAARELPIAFGPFVGKRLNPFLRLTTRHQYAARASISTYQNAPPDDIEPQSSLEIPPISEEQIQAYDPLKRAASREHELPPSRYQFRPPRYYRGPLHPHQPPPTSDPSSREFVPGPFAPSRLIHTFESTVASDLMTLTYMHKPPGTVTLLKADRLRRWDDSSPYHKNRPKRGPRGGDVLRLIERDITWRNIPRIKEVTVATMASGARTDSAYLHVAGILLQAMTGVRPTVHTVKRNNSLHGMRKGQRVSLSCTMKGEEAWAFVDKCVNLVFPKMKDWHGVKGSSGDSSGNIAWGFDQEAAILFPEVEVNYDMYPPHMIPGFHVFCKTTAKSDRHARLLLEALGVPFYGKFVD